MNKSLFYGHGGSYNHGAEAIVKSTVDVIKKRHPDSKVILSTHFKNKILNLICQSMNIVNVI